MSGQQHEAVLVLPHTPPDLVTRSWEDQATGWSCRQDPQVSAAPVISPFTRPFNLWANLTATKTSARAKSPRDLGRSRLIGPNAAAIRRPAGLQSRPHQGHILDQSGDLGCLVDSRLPAGANRWGSWLCWAVPASARPASSGYRRANAVLTRENADQRRAKTRRLSGGFAARFSGPDTATSPPAGASTRGSSP